MAPPEVSAIFCHDIRTFARRLGKKNFLLLGEVTGSTHIVRKYVDPDGPNLDCVLDIESAPGCGTWTRASIPLRQPSA